jgi:hypothetical protein
MDYTKGGFMTNSMKLLKVVCPVVLLGVLLAAGMVPAQTTAVKTDCPSQITFDVTKEAVVESFSCTVKDYKKQFPSIHYAVTIKNASDKPARFRVNIFLPDGKAVGGLLPRKGNPPAVKPGETAEAEYPVKNLVDHPATLDVIVKVMPE